MIVKIFICSLLIVWPKSLPFLMLNTQIKRWFNWFHITLPTTMTDTNIPNDKCKIRTRISNRANWHVEEVEVEKWATHLVVDVQGVR